MGAACIRNIAPVVLLSSLDLYVQFRNSASNRNQADVDLVLSDNPSNPQSSVNVEYQVLVIRLLQIASNFLVIYLFIIIVCPVMK